MDDIVERPEQTVPADSFRRAAVPCRRSPRNSARENGFDGRGNTLLTEDGTWLASAEVFLHAADDDVPGAPLVHPSVRHLTIWQKIGVAERPTADLAIEWLQELPSGEKLTADELRRIRALLSKYPYRVWDECEHWLNLDGQWVGIDSLDYSLTMQSLVPWRHLFEPIKQRTADFQRIGYEVSSQPPFSELPTLASKIEDRFQENLFGLPESQQKPWVTALGEGIARIKVDDEDEQHTIRELGRRLAATRWQVAVGLESVPYIDGTPAGTSRRIDVLWKGTTLYVEDRPVAQIFKSVAQELTRAFNRADIGEAISACIDRSTEFILDYLAENFTLRPPEAAEPPAAEAIDTEPSAVDEADSTQDIDFEFEEDFESPKAETDEAPEESVEWSPGEEIEDELHAEHDDETVYDEEDIEDAQTSHEDAYEEETSGHDEPRAADSPPRKTAKPGLIELVATAAGFEKDGTDRYFHPDGGWIQKTASSLFPWEQYAAGGKLVQSYWTKESCLRREPLQFDAALWNLCEKHPEQYSIVLRDVDDTAHVLSGLDLIRHRSQGRLTLHPANYRLVYRD